ncbi:MAG TPA: patatin-like phospholipase family protein, partial [Tepidisphaeraceae bacterium]
MSQKDHQQDPPLSELEMLKQEHLAIRGCLPPGYEEAVKNTKCEQEKLREFHRCAANDPQPLSALCFSGGGIRSATFNLGVIQGLAKCNVLRRIDYLSTVSGGGYIGGWLSAWINRHDRGSTGVFEALGQKPAVQPLAQQQVASAAPAHAAAAALRVDANADCCAPAIDCPDATVEPAPVSHLREYSNYLTPRLGLFRADSAVVAATYLRNLLLNWIVFALSMIALAMIPRLYASLIGIFTIGTTTYWILFASALALMAMATANPLWALPSSREPNSAEEENRYATRDITWVRRWIICPLLLSSILLSYLKSWGSEPLDGGIRFAAWMSTYMLPPIAVALLRRRRMDWHCLVALVFAALCTGVCARLLNKHAIEPLLGQSLILYTIFAVPSSLLLYLLLLTFFVGFSSGRRGRDEDREWWARLQGCVLLFMIGWVAVMGVIVGGPYIIAALVERDQFTRISAAVIPIIASCIGLLGGYSGSTDAQDPRKRLLRDRIIEALPVTGARVALVMIFMFAAYGINAGFTRLNGVWLVHPEYYPVVDFTKSTMLAFGESPRWPLEMFAAFPMLYQIELAPVARQVAALNSVGCCISAGLLIYLAGWAINFNRFSLHAMYRDRLIRAYLGASKRTNRTPDPFTGFDPDDNIPMHHLRRGIITPEDIDDSDVMQLADLIVRAPSEKLRILREAANDTTDLDDPSRRHDELCKIWEPFRRLQQPVVEKAAQVAALIAVEEGKAHPASKPITADNPGDGAAGVAAKPLDRGPLKQAIIRLLNKVVRLPHLARDYETEVLSHEQRTRRRKARQSSGYDAGDPELQRALGALVDDGCPKILNRLILERILVNEANRALLKVDPRHTPPRPFHVVNLALNLVNTKNLAWQERKAASFVVTPLHCGFTKGYRRSEEYGGS